MSPCPCSSEKNPSSPDYININDIGVLCFATGLQGPLCRLMDLIPDAIKAIVKLDPSKLGNHNEKIINKLLGKVIAKSFSLLIDEVTGGIPLADFCSLDPPPEPEDITYEDVYKFIADLVPVLGRFFDLNDVLTGNSTKLLDKIVAIWLRKQWFLHCQCKQCEGSPTPRVRDSEPLVCPGGSQGQAANLLATTLEIVDVPPGYGFEQYIGRRFYHNWVAVFNKTFQEYKIGERTYLCGGGGDARWLHEGCILVQTRRFRDRDSFWRLLNSIHGSQPFWDYKLYLDPDGNPNDFVVTLEWRLWLNGRPIYGVPPTSAYNQPICSDIPPPPPPPEFCNLFPDDILCKKKKIRGCTDPDAINFDPDAEEDDDSCLYCETIDVEVGLFAGCGKDRTSKTLQLFDSGDTIDVEVQVFAGCDSDRTSKILQLFDCD